MTVQNHKDFRSSQAFIIGIDDYGRGIPALRSAANDARQLATVLDKDHGCQGEG